MKAQPGLDTNVRKVVFPVAGRGTRTLPASKAVPKEMLPVVDRPLIQHAFEEAVASGIEQFIFVTSPDKGAIKDHFGRHEDLERALREMGKVRELAAVRDFVPDPDAINFVLQDEPKGLGHAVWCARELAAGEPVAVVLTDDLILSDTPCLAQLLAVQGELGGNVLAVMEVPKDQTSLYGVIEPGKETGGAIAIEGLVEKPQPDAAPSNLAVIGRYVLQPEIFDELASMEKGAGGEIQLTDALARLIGRMPFHAVRFEGKRFDCGSTLGYLEANAAFGMAHTDTGPLLRAALTELLADQGG